MPEILLRLSSSYFSFFFVFSKRIDFLLLVVKQFLCFSQTVVTVVQNAYDQRTISQRFPPRDTVRNVRPMRRNICTVRSFNFQSLNSNNNVKISGVHTFDTNNFRLRFIHTRGRS